MTTSATAIVKVLKQRHPDATAEHIEELVRAELETHRHDRVQNFRSILVARAVEDRLRARPVNA